MAKKRIIFLIAAVLFLLIPATVLYGCTAEPVIIEEETPEPEEIVEETPEPEPEPPVMMDRYLDLYEQNEDLVGWIRVPNTPIDYPVVYCEDNEFYLKHDFLKKPSSAGTPFLDMRADLFEKNQSFSTYGHYLKNGTMYSALHKYKSFDYYKSYPLFTFNTLYEEGVYKIFAVLYMAGNASDKLFYNFMQAGFSSDEKFMEHVNQLRVRSIFLTTVDVVPGDQLTLLTCCTYEVNNLRLIIAGRKIRPGEPFAVDMEKAAINPAPLYPQKWYDAKGGKPPEL